MYIVSYCDTGYILFTRVFHTYETAVSYIEPLIQDDSIIDIIFQKHERNDEIGEYTLVEAYDVIGIFADMISETSSIASNTSILEDDNNDL